MRSALQYGDVDPVAPLPIDRKPVAFRCVDFSRQRLARQSDRLRARKCLVRTVDFVMARQAAVSCTDRSSTPRSINTARKPCGGCSILRSSRRRILARTSARFGVLSSIDGATSAMEWFSSRVGWTNTMGQDGVAQGLFAQPRLAFKKLGVVAHLCAGHPAARGEKCFHRRAVKGQKTKTAHPPRSVQEAAWSKAFLSAKLRAPRP